MDNTTKKMLNQLVENYYSPKGVVREQDEQVKTEEQESNQKVFQTTDEIVKGYIKDIHDHVGNVHLSFDDLKFNQGESRVHWSGSVAGIQWVAIYNNNNPDATGVMFTTDNKKLSSTESLGLHKLNTYFHEVWFSAIRDAILNNELTK